MSDKGKTILILGNGFDLAHGLPTKYSNFLDFCWRVERIWTYGDVNDQTTIENFKNTYINGWKIDSTIKERILEEFAERRSVAVDEGDFDIVVDSSELSEIHECLKDNIWYMYLKKLYEKNRMRGENWIDFESEIRLVIKAVDEETTFLSDSWEKVTTMSLTTHFPSKFKEFKNMLSFEQYVKKKNLPPKYEPKIKDFREKAFEDLERLTRAFELYLVAFVETIPLEKKIPELLTINPDYVITFNYTNTYEKLYNKGKVYHIHGKADASRSAKENNMVLGIDEYWTGDEKNEHTYFTIFKKFAQRIQKHTGSDGYQYLQEMKKIFSSSGQVWSGGVDTSKVHPDGVSHVYVFGHSLDITDKDILSGFIGDDSTAVTVFCWNKGTEGELIANTIRLIGEEKLLDKSNHLPSKLNYIIQKNE